MTVAAWGFNFVALKLLYLPGQMDAPSVGLVRFLIMWALLAAISCFRGDSLRYPKGEALRILGLGALAMGVYMVLFLEGMKGSTAAEGAIILATAPIFTAVFAALAGQERFRLGSLVGAIIAFAGVVIVITNGVHPAQQASGKLLGNLLIFLSSIVWAYSSVYSRPLVEKYSPFRVLTLSMPGALPVLLPYGFLATLSVDWSKLQSLSWIMLLHVAVLAGVVGFAGFYAGVRQIGAAGAMLYQFLVPPTAAISAWLVLGQPMTLLQGAGLIVVLAGLALAMQQRTRTPSLPPPD
jgi:drug/metabolite transporter (DMT)-like permease